MFERRRCAPYEAALLPGHVVPRWGRTSLPNKQAHLTDAVKQSQSDLQEREHQYIWLRLEPCNTCVISTHSESVPTVIHFALCDINM